MLAIVTTLGILTFYLFPLVSLFTFLTLLPPGQVSQLSCPGVGCFSNLPAAAASLRLAGSGAKGPPPLPADPGGAHCTGFRLVSPARSSRRKWDMEERPRQICFRRKVSAGARGGSCPRRGHAESRPAHVQAHLPVGILTLDGKALFVNMLLICNFENKIETSCILKYKMKCDALYTI